MKPIKYLYTIILIALTLSIMLNAFLLFSSNDYRKHSIDLRSITFKISDKPPDDFSMKALFEDGDQVIHIKDKTQPYNSVIIYCRDAAGGQVIYYTFMDGSQSGGVVRAYYR
jgi:hypothetical protein